MTSTQEAADRPEGEGVGTGRQAAEGPSTQLKIPLTCPTCSPSSARGPPSAGPGPSPTQEPVSTPRTVPSIPFTFSLSSPTTDCAPHPPPLSAAWLRAFQRFPAFTTERAASEAREAQRYHKERPERSLEGNRAWPPPGRKGRGGMNWRMIPGEATVASEPD